MKQHNNRVAIQLILFIICSSIFILCTPKNTTYASISSGDSVNIQIDELKITSEKPKIDSQKKPDPPEILPAGTYTGNNYKITSGFDNTDIQDAFTFGLTNSTIDYGILTATNPVYRTTNMFISHYNKRFIVREYEDHALLARRSLGEGGLAQPEIFIPDTTCDNGYCSHIRSDIWENTLTYGLGFRCDDVNGIFCPIELKQDNYYKHFSDISKNESPQIIMSGRSAEANKEVQVTYKLNISKTQQNGSYSNTITYIASPGY